MQCNAIQYNTIQYNTIQYNTIQYNTIQYNTIQYNTIQYNTIQYNTIQYVWFKEGVVTLEQDMINHVGSRTGYTFWDFPLQNKVLHTRLIKTEFLPTWGTCTYLAFPHSLLLGENFVQASFANFIKSLYVKEGFYLNLRNGK